MPVRRLHIEIGRGTLEALWIEQVLENELLVYRAASRGERFGLQHLIQDLGEQRAVGRHGPQFLGSPLHDAPRGRPVLFQRSPGRPCDGKIAAHPEPTVLDASQGFEAHVGLEPSRVVREQPTTDHLELRMVEVLDVIQERSPKGKIPSGNAALRGIVGTPPDHAERTTAPGLDRHEIHNPDEVSEHRPSGLIRKVEVQGRVAEAFDVGRDLDDGFFGGDHRIPPGRRILGAGRGCTDQRRQNHEPAPRTRGSQRAANRRTCLLVRHGVRASEPES